MNLLNMAVVYLRSGLYSFSASANEVLHEQIVEKHKYLTDAEYIRMMSLGAMVPGPFHVNLVIATGYTIAGIRGAIIAVSAFILPGFLIAVFAIVAVQAIVETDLTAKLSGVAAGIMAAVAGLVVSVLTKLASKYLVTTGDKLTALAALIFVYYFGVSFVGIILTAGFGYSLLSIAGLRRNR